MKIVRTFAVIENSLISVLYENEEVHEFVRLFSLWNDAEYLEEFFHKHQIDLRREFWGRISVEDAISKTRKDAKLLERKLIQIAQYGRTNNDETLSAFFKPLHDNPSTLDPYEKNKAYGFESYGKPSWLRIYAIRLDINLFVVSGGAIKLTKGMDRPHLENELRKLEVTQRFCQENPELTLGYFELE